MKKLLTVLGFSLLLMGITFQSDSKKLKVKGEPTIWDNGNGTYGASCEGSGTCAKVWVDKDGDLVIRFTGDPNVYVILSCNLPQQVPGQLATGRIVMAIDPNPDPEPLN